MAIRQHHLSSEEDSTMTLPELTITLDLDAQELVADALGHLYVHAPLRREEIKNFAISTGLAIAGDE